MPRYRLTSTHFINGALQGPGTEVELDLPPSPDMEPLDDAAKAAIESMPWAGRGWKLEMTRESSPGGRHEDGSPVLFNRPANMGAPLTRNPPQPDLTKEIPFGCRPHRIKPREPREAYWGKDRGSIFPGVALRPYSPED